MNKTNTGMKAMINAAKTCWNRLGNSLAGWFWCVCTSCGTTPMGEERSLMKRGLSNSSHAAAHRGLGGGISLLSGLFYTPLAFAFLLNISVGENSKGADPIMDVSYSAEIGEYDWITPIDNPQSGLEKKNIYLVPNISPENIQDNNLIEFLLPGGSNQGVYYANDDTGNWMVQILENQTKFIGNGEFIPVGENNTFYTYVSENQPMGSGFAEALARGDGAGQLDFNQVETTVAITMTYTNNVPVTWLKAYGYTNDFDAASLSDPDSDTFFNWQEYHADTDPTNASSYLSLSITATNLLFQSSANCNYALEECNSLTSNVWNVFTNLSGTGSEMSTIETHNFAAKYYRLKAWRKD